MKNWNLDLNFTYKGEFASSTFDEGINGEELEFHVDKLSAGPLFTRKTPSYQYRDTHYKPETVVRPS